MKKFGIKEVVATGIGTALFIVLTEVIPPVVAPAAYNVLPPQKISKLLISVPMVDASFCQLPSNR